MKKTAILKMVPLLQIVLIAACGTDSPQRVLAPSGEITPSLRLDADRNDDGGARFSDWSTPTNVGAPVNSAAAEQGPAISKDGLSLYFVCGDCPGGHGGVDIWVSERSSVDQPWGQPRNLGPSINTPFNDGSPALSTDGHRLFFDSNRPGGFGGFDLYIARRTDKRDNLGWGAAVNLGPAFNTNANEQGAEYFPGGNDGDTDGATLYFTSNRAGGPGNEDIYTVRIYSNGTFGSPALVDGLNTSSRESGPAIRKDGNEIVFVSDRPGGFGGVDLWVATRAGISEPWSTPVNLGQPINSGGNDGGPAFSFHGTSLYFHSPRAGGVGGTFFDIWLLTREKLKGRSDD